jgi:hypothetical protein
VKLRGRESLVRRESVRSGYPETKPDKIRCLLRTYILVLPEFCPNQLKRGSRGSAILEPEVIRWRPICEPQTSLWKVAARPISPARAIIELMLLALFFLITLAVMANCLSELPHLLHSDPAGQVAQRVLNRGA